MFSDDEDVSRHAAVLDQVHDTIIHSKKWSSNSVAADNSKENQSRTTLVSLENDPVCRRILAEKRRPLGDVFILPMTKPASDGNEYEFSSDTEKGKNQDSTPTRSMDRTPSANTSTAPQSRRSTRSNSVSSSNTPRLSYRKRTRLRRLFKASVYASFFYSCFETRQSQSDDDQEFIPSLSIPEYESLLRERPESKMSLRPRKELWTDEDELPLYDIQSIMRMDSMDNEICSKSEKPSVEQDPKKSCCNEDDCADFAFLPSIFLSKGAEELTPKCSRRTPGRGSSKRKSRRSTRCDRKASEMKTVHPPTSENLPSNAKRRHSGSDTDMDAPLSLFTKSRSRDYRAQIRMRPPRSTTSTEAGMENIQKSLEGLSLEEKVAKLVKRLADSEEHNVKLKEKAAQIREDSLNKVRLLEHERHQLLNNFEEPLRERQYWQEYNKAKDIEIKLLKTKLEAAEIFCAEICPRKGGVDENLVEGTARIGGALENEKALREEVKRYAGRYEEITRSLAESNAAFDKFKKEIDRVNSNFKKVETDAFKWKQKYEE
ncbi:hypothetical protein OSTOST_05922, partial [Ostertagia ostertagi]